MRTRRPAVSHRVRLTGPAGAVVMVLTVAACAGGASDRTATSTGVPDPDPIPPGVAEAESFPASVHPAVPDPRIGALFLGGGPVHTCTGTVLDSRTQDLVLTAAHCLADGVDTTFVPGFDPAAADTDPWHVTAIYLDPRWLADQDEQADFAIVRVTRHDGTTIEQQVGGGLALASAPAAGTAVAVTGYLVGEGGALTCRGVTTMADDGFPSLECAGVADGFSGAPWVTGSAVAGLVGGLDGGGCDEDTSYSPRFDGGVERLLARAEAGDASDAGDAAPAADAPAC
ncbi:trypsin-like serine peptidase [Mycolicibacterium smegmatis]|uniref:trypsin-like serine peptidase n=1 Tax=Mycolicibacterium smegmatis TaxID=1772 RepID=UPI000AB5A6B7|nr:trypsin-like peptidase domain-containing protein [Mycolicibacterium smegmatis]MCC3337877.1 serine protease [Mycolicibacterium smegmatis]MCO4195987.1 serine protease [Mycolicibacterium smegmatis]UUR98896.1 serine protease [Mycolicibacterium smegmatis]UUS05450.1 serine protease [Mycolicibacterium smegmatis]UUS12008.1 serine protease [Mycolicibacterium smegmatis]